MGPTVVVDTSVFVSALIGARARRGRCAGLSGRAVRAGDGREALPGIRSGRAPAGGREGLAPAGGGAETLLDAFSSVCVWVPVYYLWRPNLPDEGDNHVVELAVAARPRRL